MSLLVKSLTEAQKGSAGLYQWTFWGWKDLNGLIKKSELTTTFFEHKWVYKSSLTGAQKGSNFDQCQNKHRKNVGAQKGSPG